MKDRLRNRRRSMAIPARYKIRLNPRYYDPDGWPKDHTPPLWRGTFRRGTNGMLYRETQE